MAKKTAAKSASTKKKLVKRAAKKAAGKTVAAKQSAAKRKAAPAAAGKAPAAESSLGRPKVTGDEKLYWLFHEDYHARQVFEFLRVETVRELEEYSPQEIIHRLTQPVRDTVENIRKALAEKNRHLAGDLDFALKWKSEEEKE
jgi:hypothetical protein